LRAPGPEQESQTVELLNYCVANEEGLSDYRRRVDVEGVELRGLGAIESNIDKNRPGCVREAWRGRLEAGRTCSP